MSSMTLFKATTILSFCTSVFAAPTAETISYTEADLQGLNSTAAPWSSAGPGLQERGIIGADNRVLWDHQEYPYNAMGRVTTSTGGICSGTLIGPRHMVTAKHCTSAGATYRFAPNYYQGERLGSAGTAAVITMDAPSGSCGSKEDWAIIILDQRLGDKYGYLGAKVIDPNTQLNKPIFFHFGYPGDHGADKPYRQEAISASSSNACEPGGPIETDADAVPGQSGGPLWINENGSRYQYGVLSLTSSTGSGFAAGGNFVNAIVRARNDFP
ncbi:trypsin-like serine protease [Thozetella sp. PMI_491]|nr:trypsin-like serine protease [Thozetella sp. PMI_491]